MMALFYVFSQTEPFAETLSPAEVVLLLHVFLYYELLTRGAEKDHSYLGVG